MTSLSQQIIDPSDQSFTIFDGQKMPHSIEAEERLLAGVLQDDTGGAWAIANSCGLKAKAFYNPAARIVWDVLTKLSQTGKSGVDIALLAEELKEQGKIDEVGGYKWLVQISKQQPTSLNVRYYAERLRYLWEKRHTVSVASELREVALAHDNHQVFAEKTAKVGQRLIGLGRKSATKTMSEEIDETREHYLAQAEGRDDKNKLVSSGLEDFDRRCTMFGSGGADDRLIMLGAGSGHGKSAALRQMARAAIQRGQRVLVYTREQGAGEFVAMMASSELSYDLALVTEQPKDRVEAFNAEMQRIDTHWGNRSLFVFSHTPTTPLLTIEDLIDHSLSWSYQHGPPHLLIVDYLQMFGTRGCFPNSEARVGHIAYALQALQREIGCVMAVGVQLNESGLAEARHAKHDAQGKIIHNMPHRGWIRDSQQIYHAADRMIFLYVPPENAQGKDQYLTGLTRLEVWWHQEKRRKGPCFAVKTIFEKRYLRFEPFSP